MDLRLRGRYAPAQAKKMAPLAFLGRSPFLESGHSIRRADQVPCARQTRQQRTAFGLRKAIDPGPGVVKERLQPHGYCPFLDDGEQLVRAVLERLGGPLLGLPAVNELSRERGGLPWISAGYLKTRRASTMSSMTSSCGQRSTLA